MLGIKILFFYFCPLFVKTKKSAIFISLDEILSFSFLIQTKFRKVQQKSFKLAKSL